MLLNQRYHNTHTHKKKRRNNRKDKERSKFLTFHFTMRRGASFLPTSSRLLFVLNKQKRRAEVQVSCFLFAACSSYLTRERGEKQVSFQFQATPNTPQERKMRGASFLPSISRLLILLYKRKRRGLSFLPSISKLLFLF